MTNGETRAPFIRRVALKNYRSIAKCDVRLGPLTFLVGANGSGKSNFVDALRLISDSVVHSLDHALRERGGIEEVRRRSTGHPNNFGIRIEFTLADGPGYLAFDVAARQGGTYVVKREDCRLGPHHYKVESGVVRSSSVDTPPPATDDRLYLVNAAGLPQFRPLYEGLTRMGFYNLNPAEIRKPQTPDRGEILRRDGSNVASVLERLKKSNGGAAHERIVAYLARVVEGVEGVETTRVGHMETLEFRQRMTGADRPWRFPAINMSDGTLRGLGILTALFQKPEKGDMPLVAIEEPEVALHPAAAGVLRDCLREASGRTQVLVTSHSPDLLDDEDVASEELLAVSAEGGETEVGSLDETGRSALRDRLYTAGELLRTEQLRPDPTMRRNQLDLFAEEP